MLRDRLFHEISCACLNSNHAACESSYLVPGSREPASWAASCLPPPSSTGCKDTCLYFTRHMSVCDCAPSPQHWNKCKPSQNKGRYPGSNQRPVWLKSLSPSEGKMPKKGKSGTGID